jgi:hypothetical protein
MEVTCGGSQEWTTEHTALSSMMVMNTKKGLEVEINAYLQKRKPGGTGIPFEFQHSIQHVGILQLDECLHNEIKGCRWK